MLSSLGCLTDVSAICLCKGHVNSQPVNVNVLSHGRRIHHDAILGMQHAPKLRRQPASKKETSEAEPVITPPRERPHLYWPRLMHEWTKRQTVSNTR